MSILRIPRRSAMSREQAKMRHPSAQSIWEPADFQSTVADALAMIANDTATIYDFATGEVIS